MAPRGCVRSRPSGRCRSIRPMLQLTRVRTRGSKRCVGISRRRSAAPIKARQACFRPVTEDRLPLIGAVPGVEGAYVATGHSVWGMLNPPAHRRAMSELILDRAADRDELAPLAPARL